MILSNGQLLAMGTLSELRQQAALPVVIKPSGLNSVVTQDTKLNTFLTHSCQNTLMVPEHEKLAVLKQLLSIDGLDDIHIESANLEQVYQHFLEQHEQQLQQIQGAQES